MSKNIIKVSGVPPSAVVINLLPHVTSQLAKTALQIHRPLLRLDDSLRTEILPCKVCEAVSFHLLDSLNRRGFHSSLRFCASHHLLTAATLLLHWHNDI